jgi:hypothetical protein
MSYFDINFARRPARLTSWINRLPLAQQTDTMFVVFGALLIALIWCFQQYQLHSLRDTVATLRDENATARQQVIILQAENTRLNTDLQSLAQFDQAQYALASMAATLATWKKSFPAHSTIASAQYSDSSLNSVAGRADSDPTVAKTYSALQWKTDWSESRDGNTFTYTFGVKASTPTQPTGGAQ